MAKKTGAEIVVVPDDKHGQIDLAALERAIDKRTKLVSISHIPTQGGLVQPAEAVGKIVNDAGILYLLDACQSVGMMPIDVKKIGCDFLSATGRKYMRGPRGTGFLYARTRSTSQIEPIFLDNHAARWTGDNEYTVIGDAKRFENWERYFAGVIGLKDAADQSNELGMPAIWARLRELADGLRARLDEGERRDPHRPRRHQGRDRDLCRRRHGAPRAEADLARTAHQRLGLDAVLVAPRSQGPRPARRDARLGARLQHRGRA